MVKKGLNNALSAQITEGYEYAVKKYDKKGNFLFSSDWITSAEYGLDFDGYIRLQIRKSDDSDISAPNTYIEFKFKNSLSKSDNAIQKFGVPSLILKCSKEINFSDGTPPKTVAFLCTTT